MGALPPVVKGALLPGPAHGPVPMLVPDVVIDLREPGAVAEPASERQVIDLRTTEPEPAIEDAPSAEPDTERALIERVQRLAAQLRESARPRGGVAQPEPFGGGAPAQPVAAHHPRAGRGARARLQGPRRQRPRRSGVRGDTSRGPGRSPTSPLAPGATVAPGDRAPRRHLQDGVDHTALIASSTSSRAARRAGRMAAATPATAAIDRHDDQLA